MALKLKSSRSISKGGADNPRREPLLTRDPESQNEPERDFRCRLIACLLQVAWIKALLQISPVQEEEGQKEEEEQVDDITKGEWAYLLTVFLIGSMYTYGPLMGYPLYKGLVQARGEAEVSPTTVAICFFSAKVSTQVLHYWLCSMVMRRPGAGLRSLQALVVGMYTICAIGLVAAAHPSMSPLGILAGICSLNLVSSRTLSGALFAAPREDMFKKRTFAYDVGSVAGCLWTALALAMFQCEYARSSTLFRYLSLAIPLVFCLTFWLLLSPQKFFNASRLMEAQIKILSACAEKRSEAVKRSLTSSGTEVREAPRVERLRPAEDDSQSAITTTAPRSPRSDASIEELSDVDVKEGEASLALSDSLDALSEDAAIPGRRFLLCASQCLLFWSFNFYAYTVFPVLIARKGPSLETVSTLYTVEGLLYTGVMVILLPKLRSHFNALYFGSIAGVALTPLLSICVLGRIHWSGYLLGLWCSDMFCSISQSVFGLVCLRCLPWDTLPEFYSWTNTIGGLISALSNVQFALDENFGWRITVLVGHGVPLSLLLLTYFRHARTMSDIWVRLAPPDAAAEVH